MVSPNGLEIAIIGAAGRFPGSPSVPALWRNLVDAVECIRRFTPAELAADPVAAARLEQPNFVAAGGVLEGFDQFDAAFFGMAPREADLMDPQQRLLLECAWQAIEAAGYDPGVGGASKVGVYAGVGHNAYMSAVLRELGVKAGAGNLLAGLLGNDRDFLATRIAYKLNLKGPALTVQTACSTSLVAVHLACQDLLSGGCDMALAGGAFLAAPYGLGYLYEEGGILSPDGHCRAFDAAARGTVRGDGVALVVLKRLERALADRDRVLAVIKGSAVNNDGADKVGYTAPGISGQSSVIRAAQAVAEVAPHEIGYIEAHGTGTPLGDPIEIAALTDVFAGSPRGSCTIGSLKTNIGHLDAAAGVAGLIKAALALHERVIPASLNFERPNPQIDFERGPFCVNTRTQPWYGGAQPRRAGVSSFGFGGTNAHVVLEEAPAREELPVARPWQLLTASARTAAALEQATGLLGAHLREHPEISLADAAYTQHVGRRAFAHRRAVVAQGRMAAISDLESAAAPAGAPGAADRAVIFMFPGQGAQHVRMAARVYASEPHFREVFDHCAQQLIAHVGCDLRDIIYPTDAQLGVAAAQIDATQIAQPALFAVEYALAQLWIRWGIEPVAMIGHSIGEWAAACLAGVFSLDDALALVATRGRLMQAQRPGCMLAAHLAEQALRPQLHGSLEIAAFNAAGLCTVSGADEDIATLESALKDQGVLTKRLRTSHAFHSTAMEPALEPFRAAVAAVRLRPPRIPFVSNVSGTWIEAVEATDPDYWARQLRAPVRFAAGLDTVLQPQAVLLEIGPGSTLTGLARGAIRSHEGVLAIASLRAERGPDCDAAALTAALGKVWCSGKTVNWSAYHAHESRNRVELPTYPFERQRHWLAASQSAEADAGAAPATKRDLSDWFYTPAWRQSVVTAVSPPSAERVLVVAPTFAGDAVAASLVQRLTAAGRRVVQVEAGDRYARVGDDCYRVDCRRRDSYATLLADLRTDGQEALTVFHVVGADPERVVSDESLLAFESLYSLAQALSEHTVAHATTGAPPVRIVAVTSRMQCVHGDEALIPERATILGACRVIPQELANVRCRSVDIPERAEARTIDALLHEPYLPEQDAAVALRGSQRWVLDFAPIRLLAEGAQGRLRTQGVYLITGGLGGIGLEIAAWLARTCRARLVLAGRSRVPPREEWASLMRDPQSRWGARLRKVEEVERAGGEVLLLQADVADEAQMQAALAVARARFGTIHGVFHAAGVAPAKLIQLSRGPARDVLAPKIQGARVLERVLAAEPLELWVLCSSLRAIAGGLGAAEYAAANCFLDAFARAWSTDGCTVVSILWDGWRDTGMTAATVEDGDDRPVMTAAEALNALDRILCASIEKRLAEVIVTTQSLPARLAAQRTARSQTQLGAVPAATQQAAAHARPELSTAYVAPGTDVERALAQIWQDLLGVDRIGTTDNFFELGGDSVISIQVLARANQAGLKFSPKDVFEAQTIAELARKVREAAAERESPQQDSADGELLLAPIQQWFFEQPSMRSLQWTQVRAMAVAAELSAADLERVLTELATHHDLLRARFHRRENGWQGRIEAPAGATALDAVDLAGCSDQEREGRVADIVTQSCGAIDIERGPLLRGVLLKSGERAPAQLLLCAHHLCVDVLSWGILLEDCARLCEQALRKRPLSLQPKTTSYGRWAQRWVEHARSSELEREIDYWRNLPWRALRPLPADHPRGMNTASSAQRTRVSLEAERTGRLLQAASSSWGIPIDSLLLAALATTLAEWSGASAARVDVEGHGRGVWFEGVDVSRTVGWFTSIYPAVVQLAGGCTPSAVRNAARVHAAQLPKHGMGYGVLRYLRGDDPRTQALRDVAQGEVSFLYLGQHGRGGGERLATPQPAADAARAFLLEVEAHVERGCLWTTWTFSAAVHRPQTIAALAERCNTLLSSLLDDDADELEVATFDFSEADVREDVVHAVLESIEQRD